MPHVQIRNMPDDLHRTLKARAASAGMSLSEYLLQELNRSASKPTMEEFVELVRRRGLVRLRTLPADLIRADREAR